MYSSIVVVSAFLSSVLAVAHPEVTLQARSPVHHADRIQLLAMERRAAALYSRQEAGDLGFCFGTNSICAKSNDLNDECDDLYGEDEKWWKCLCTNGYVSTREA